MRYRLGDYVLDTERHELQCAGAPITLRRKVFQVLVYHAMEMTFWLPQTEATLAEVAGRGQSIVAGAG